MPKHLPTLLVAHYDSVLKHLMNKKDKKEINELLQIEGICDIVPRSVQSEFHLIDLFVITQLGTVLLVTYDT